MDPTQMLLYTCLRRFGGNDSHSQLNFTNVSRLCVRVNWGVAEEQQSRIWRNLKFACHEERQDRI